MRMIVLWAAFWLLLLLPVLLVVLGRRASVLGGVGETGQRGAVHFARGFAAASSVLPLVLLVLGVSPLTPFDNILTTLTLYLPILGALAGLCALVLYLVTGRGVERWTGSVASILAVGWLVLLVMAGRAAS